MIKISLCMFFLEMIGLAVAGRQKDEATSCSVPVLPQEGSCLEAFVAEDWKLMDCVELDFNGDGICDYVGVQEAIEPRGARCWIPRVLFAVAGDENGNYHLEFQDENLIRTRGEGGVFGDPYLPLTAEGSSFTTHGYGGSGWRWSEDYTYTWKEGTWYLTYAKNIYGYGQYITSYKEDNWETGVGVRKKRSSAFEDMEKNEGKKEEADWDIAYELSLDKPLTLFQAGKRSNLLPYRVRNWEVSRVEQMEGIELSPDKIRYPGSFFLMDYRDEEGIFYSFSEEEAEGSYLYSPLGEERGKNYLAFYRWEDSVLFILAEEESEIGQVEYDQGKVYYVLEGTKLCRMNLDGSEKETVFDYLALEKNKQGYMALNFEIKGGEIVVEMYLGDYPHPYYRMNTDGSGLHEIGQVPAASA